MAALYSVAEIVAATGGQAQNVTASDVSSISIDSRDILPGALFVAIPGDRFDGYDFVAAAIKGGAVAALVAADRADGLGDLPLIVVPDALEGLVDLAQAARARSSAKIVAITGSVGKTSTKEMVGAVLSVAGKTHAAVRSFNNHWGVPLTLARLPRDAAFGVFEIGMSNPGEITPLVKLVAPDVAVITAIAPAHLEFLGSLEAIAKAKAEIFSGLKLGGTAIINADHDFSDLLRAAALEAGVEQVVSYGFSEAADVRIEDVVVEASGMGARVDWPDMSLSVHTGAPGRHQLANGVAALCVARAFDVDMTEAASALGQVAALEGRGAQVRLGPSEKPLVLVDESFNANPVSMAAALEVFTGLEAPDGRKVLILGDMLELGAEAGRLHAALATAVISSMPDAIFLVGDNMVELGKKLPGEKVLSQAGKVEEIETQALNSLDYGDIVMVKGSKGVRLSHLVLRILDRFGPADTVSQAGRGAE